MPAFERILVSDRATAAWAAGVADLLQGGDCVYLAGELGAGKTTFVRALARAIGADDRAVASPTFVMINEYPVAPGPARIRGVHRLVHMDAYRLQSLEELDALGWDRIVTSADPPRVHDDAMLIVEWPQRIADALPPLAHALRIELAHSDFADQREVRVTAPESWLSRPAWSLLHDREPKQCPIRGTWVSPTNPSYPFADQQAKMADLNRWFTGSYNLSRPLDESETDEV